MKKILFVICSSALILSCNSKDDNKLSINHINSKDSILITASLSTSNNVYKEYDKKILPYLEKYVALLENGSINNYDWVNNCSCNIGLLAQLTSNKTEKELYTELHNDTDFNNWADKMSKRFPYFETGSWTNRVNYYCGITNRKVSGIIGDLQNAGFTASDISSLEFLSDKNILQFTNIETEVNKYYADKDNLIKYLQAWIFILKSTKI